MKKVFRLIPVLALIVIFAVSCQFPTQQTEEPAGGEAPNLTLTALFDTSLNIPPTVTPVVNPTAEQVVPTATVPTAVPTDTATVIPTNTFTATAVPPTATLEIKQRAGTQMKAGYLSTEPVMDGTYAEWLDDSYKYRIPYIVWKPANWKNQEDLEGAFAAAWDEDYLYVSVKVTDDIYAQNEMGKNLYLGDSVELLIDTNLLGDFYVQTLDGDDFQFGFSAGKKSTNIEETYLWYPAGSAGSKSSVKIASLFETSPIYRIEVAIPWSLLGVTPQKGMRLGFAVSVSDNDVTSENLQQTMISTAQYRNFLNPTTWGELILVK